MQVNNTEVINGHIDNTLDSSDLFSGLNGDTSDLHSDESFSEENIQGESVGDNVETEHIESSDSVGIDLPSEENNSYNLLLEEIEKLQTSTELVDYSESLGLIVEKLDTIIVQNQDLHYYQLTIIDHLLYFKYFSYAVIVVFVIKAFSRFLENVLFKYL